MKDYGLERLSPAEVSEGIVDEMFGRAAWERIYAKSPPLTQEELDEIITAMAEAEAEFRLAKEQN